jgi:hypothetical protein
MTPNCRVLCGVADFPFRSRKIFGTRKLAHMRGLVVETALQGGGRMKSETNPLQWKDVYREAELYKAAIRVYTKPLFQWRKALNVSSDGGTLYDFAARGLRGLDTLHRALAREAFEFRPSVGLKFNFNGKRRTLYIPPWEERIVDLLIYRLLNQRLHSWFSDHSYAYRERGFALDVCQQRIAGCLRGQQRPLYVVKRDISNYFASVDHEILREQVKRHVAGSDYLFALIEQRIRFVYDDEEGRHQANVGVPFGCASACVLANLYLTGLDRAVGAIPGLRYFRYADDLLLISSNRHQAVAARELVASELCKLKLTTKASHESDLTVSADLTAPDEHFSRVAAFRYLGLQFEAGGAVSLSKDKRRKIQNLFRFAFRRKKRVWSKITKPEERARTLAAIAAETIERGVRNVSVIDYYLKHVSVEAQLRLLDRWLAEEVLSLVFGGHKKGHFEKIEFSSLREMGLPSLVHRRRMILRGKIESPFFVWKMQKQARALRGTVARMARAASAGQSSLRTQKQQPEMPVREGGCL